MAEAFEPQIEFAIANLYDFKSELQERLARRGEVVDLPGRVARRARRTTGCSRRSPRSTAARSDRAAAARKKDSEQEAARTALETLDAEEASAEE